jgi:hypothetical protein
MRQVGPEERFFPVLLTADSGQNEIEKLVSGANRPVCIAAGLGRNPYECRGFRAGGAARNVSKSRYTEAQNVSIYRYVWLKNYRDLDRFFPVWCALSIVKSEICIEISIGFVAELSRYR